MAFVIKRGDLRPNLPFQIFHSDGVTPLDLSTAEGVSIVVKNKAGATEPSTPVFWKKPCTLTDDVNGLGYYEWEDEDTALAGSYSYEFEITWADDDPQTVPVDSYFELTIVADLG